MGRDGLLESLTEYEGANIYLRAPSPAAEYSRRGFDRATSCCFGSYLCWLAAPLNGF
jgi:hypothetical protein